MAPKPNDSWHPCGDYRHLNTVTVPDKISFTKFARPFHPSSWCNNILQTGYYQVPMDHADVPKNGDHHPI
jgi:hypothetical protein